MKIFKFKKLQLTTVLLFILTILIMLIGLMLIGLYHGKEIIIVKNSFITKKHFNKLIIKYNGFELLSKYSWYYILSNNNISFKNFDTYYYIIQNYNFASLLQLQIGIIFSVILIPILIVILLIFSFILLKIKYIKNNKFWDTIQNCEIINNYYVH